MLLGLSTEKSSSTNGWWPLTARAAECGATFPVRHRWSWRDGPFRQCDAPGQIWSSLGRSPCDSLDQALAQEYFETFVSVNGDDLWLMHHFLQPDEH